MSLVGFTVLALMGRMQPSPTIDCETAIRIGRNFVNKHCDASEFVLTECQNQLNYNDRSIVGWTLKFSRGIDRFFMLRLSLTGQVYHLENCGDRMIENPNEDNSWHRGAYLRSLEIIRSQGYALPSEYPSFQRYSRSIFFPICVNGIPFANYAVGFSLSFGGKNLKLVGFSSQTQVPPVNAKFPLVTSSQALAEIKRNHPSDPDYESKMTATKVIYGTPELRYFAEYSYSPPRAAARLVWLTVINTRSKSTRWTRGGKSGFVVDALTGKEIELKTSISVN